MSLALLLALAAGCDGGDAPAIDTRAGDARVADAHAIDAALIDAPAVDASLIDASLIDAGVIDAPLTDAPLIDAPLIDAPLIDAHAIDAHAIDAHIIDGQPGVYQCAPLDLTATQACAIALTGRITACSIGADGLPSQTASLEVRRPDGSRGYLCATTWTSSGGFYFGNRLHLVAAAAACCGGPTSPQVGWPAIDDAFGVPHGPTHVKPQEMQAASGGDLRQNPFALIVSSPAAAALFNQQRATWLSWAGDGQPHPAPDGTGAYYFPDFTAIDYLVVPTADGTPLIVIAPEVSLDAANTRPLGHPTLGACAGHGGAPFAFIGGDIQNTTLTNGSGRFGYESTVTAADLDNAARLFNCYGIAITNVTFSAP